MNNQLCIPQQIYDAYMFFEKTKDGTWTENPFIFLKKIHGIPVKIAKNISNLNYYQIDIPVNRKINTSYLIKYLKDIDYRNYYSSDSISFKEIKKENENLWVEVENYQGVDIKYIVNYNETQFYILFYNNNWFPENINTSQTKYYHSFKILNSENEYILRFEMILNNMDIDQIIDIQIYLDMLINILRAIYKKFNIIFKLDHSLELETKQYLELRRRRRKTI
jgi:hypothetical protein